MLVASEPAGRGTVQSIFIAREPVYNRELQPIPLCNLYA